MFEKHFGLQCDPFGMTPDPHFFLETPVHREALASLRYSIRTQRGFTALIAPPGMGKTTLLFHLLGDIRESARSVFMFDTRYGSRDLLFYILRDLNIEPKATAPEMVDQFYDVLLQVARSGRQFVLVIDEAQNLPGETLETVRLLSNFERPGQKLMHIILAGQMQLSNTLLDPSLDQLRQRISTICRLSPLSPAETAEYIDHRLRRAGYKGNPLFTAEALEEIAVRSGGIPRTINVLCFNALSLCCAMKRAAVDKAMVEEVVTDLQMPRVSTAAAGAPVELTPGHIPPRRARRWHVAGTCAALAATLLLAVQAGDRLHRLRLAASVPVVHAATQSLQPADIEDPHQTPAPAPVMRTRQITVQADQTLNEIATRELGSNDKHLLLEIQALNPGLKDLDLITTGQTLTLPLQSSSPTSRIEDIP